MEDKLNEMDKSVLRLMVSMQYLDYCIEIEKEKIKKVIFEHNGTLFSPKQVKRLITKLANGDDVENWEKLVKKISKMAGNDKQFELYLKECDSLCEKCDAEVVKNKVSKYHPEWLVAQKDYWKTCKIKNKDEYVRVEQVLCPDCKHTFYQYSGIDKKPEEGIE
jgi:hypothetical protein